MSIFSFLRKQNDPKELISKDSLNQAFADCADVQQDRLSFGVNHDIHVLIIYNEGLCDTKQLNNHLLPELDKILKHEQVTPSDPQSLLKELQQLRVKIETQMDRLMSKVFEGQLVLFFEDLQEAYALDISDPPLRNPEQANTEITIRGPRDGFIEDLPTNVALLRKRLPTSSLKYEQFVLGRRSQTKIALLYIHDMIRPEVLNEVKRRLSNIDIEAIINTNQLEELMAESSYPLFPIFQYTARADFTADSLLSGRFAIFLDGLPTAIIGPLNFMLLLKTAEDVEVHFLYNSFERLMRIVGVWIASSLVGFWVAITSFHPDQLPLVLLASLTNVRQGVPLPTPVEALIMVLMFELFREAGMRLPMAIGQVLAVVGGLIVGDAAIRSGLTSPAMVLVVAVSAVATFTLVNQSLQGVVSLIRLFILICSAFLGMYGFLISSFLVLLYASNLRSFGLPYLVPLSPLHFRDLMFAVFRPSWGIKKHRPNFFRSQDEQRKGDAE